MGTSQLPGEADGSKHFPVPRQQSSFAAQVTPAQNTPALPATPALPPPDVVPPPPGDAAVPPVLPVAELPPVPPVAELPPTPPVVPAPSRSMLPEHETLATTTATTAKIRVAPLFHVRMS